VVCALLHYAGRQDAEQDLSALLTEFVDQASAEEPGLLSYVVTQAMGSSTHFVVHAQFTDWSAFEAHAETPHMQRFLPRLTALLAAPISMELYRGA
jgi:quinol monooxygenase YgiN